MVTWPEVASFPGMAKEPGNEASPEPTWKSIGMVWPRETFSG